MMDEGLSQFMHYPDTEEIDVWVDSILELADKAEFLVEFMSTNGFPNNLGVYHTRDCRFVKFSIKGMNDFYGYWQSSWSGQGPLLVHVPGYGSEFSIHPELAASGYNILHISPLGYNSPNGFDETKRRNGSWPVLPDTIISGAEAGYKLWLMNCAIAVKWAMGLPDVANNRVSFFGTSQGGGGAILLGSLFKDRGVRCIAADVPFLTNFPMAAGRGAYYLAVEGLEAVEDKSAGWKAIGFIDTLSHVHRLSIPVLLTQGSEDEVCPPETIESLYKRLNTTRSITYINGVGHRYTTEFMSLAFAWFRLYA